MTPLDGESPPADVDTADIAVDYVSVPDDHIMFWPREQAPAWVLELIGATDGPTKGFVGYIPPQFVYAIPIAAAFPHGRYDETGDGGYVVQTPWWPVQLHAVGL